MCKIQVTQPTFLINLDNPTEVSYVPMEGNWKSIIVETYQHGFPEIQDNEILYVYKENRGYIKKQVMISDDFQIGPNGAYEHVGNDLDIAYQDLLQDILDNGVEKKDRTGTGTLSVFGRQIRHKMSDGFPLLTTKKMAWKTMVTELLWFLRGDTNIKYLVDNNCHIWDGDAYKNYCKHFMDEYLEKNELGESYRNSLRPYPIEEFINKIKTDDEFANKWGELGPIYGDSRRLMVSAWNVGELDQMVLPPCHYGFQVYTRELSYDERFRIAYKDVELRKTLEAESAMIHYPEGHSRVMDSKNIPTRAISLMWNQRSVDTFLGLPFNIASYGLLLEIIAKEINMVPDELIGNLGDVHLYSNHIEQAKEQINRVPFELPIVKLSSGHNLRAILKGNFDEVDPNDIMLINYQSHPTIKAPLSN